MNREIKMGQIDGRICKYSYVDTFPAIDEDGREVVKKGTETMDTPVHDDMRKVFRDAIAHFVLLTGQLKETKEIKNAVRDGLDDETIPTTSIFFPYGVDSFKITGNGDNEAVSFKGTRILEDGGILKLESPPRKWTDLNYEFISELAELVEVMKEEVYQYSQGKKQPPPPDLQTGIDFDGMDFSVTDVSDQTGDI